MENVIGDQNEGDIPKSKEVVSNMCFISKIKPKNVKEALTHECWINSMQEELVQFERNKIWEVVPISNFVNFIGTKWLYKNKSDENSNVTRSKAHLVAQGYTQIEEVDFGETFFSCCLIGIHYIVARNKTCK